MTSLLDCPWFTWSFGCASREMADHLVGVHVGGCAAASLENVDYELIVMLAGRDGVGSLRYGRSQLQRQLSDSAVHSRGRALNQPKEHG